MKTEQVRVKVLEDGMRAREVNYIEKPPHVSKSELERKTNKLIMGEFIKAEEALRTFEIEGAPIMWSEFAFDKVHTAEIIGEGKIKIID